MLSAYRKRDYKVSVVLTPKKLPEDALLILRNVKKCIAEEKEREYILQLYRQNPQLDVATAIYNYFTRSDFAILRNKCDERQNDLMALRYAEEEFDAVVGANIAKIEFSSRPATPKVPSRREKLFGSSSGSGMLLIQDPLDDILDFIESADKPSLQEIKEHYTDEPETQAKAIRLFEAVRSEEAQFAFFNAYRAKFSVRRQIAKAHVVNNFICEADVVKNLQAQRSLDLLARGTEYAPSPKGALKRDVLEELDTAVKTNTASERGHKAKLSVN